MTAYNFVSLVPDNQPPLSPRWESNNAWPSFIEFQYSLGGTALVNGDTITTPANALPAEGIRIAEVELNFPPLDTNATPTGTFNVGDSASASRFILSASMGGSNQVHRVINQAQGLTNGVVTTGSNYLYASDDATFGIGTNGPELILAVNAVLATAATTGTIRLKVWYWCTGEQ